MFSAIAPVSYVEKQVDQEMVLINIVLGSLCMYHFIANISNKEITKESND